MKTLPRTAAVRAGITTRLAAAMAVFVTVCAIEAFGAAAAAPGREPEAAQPHQSRPEITVYAAASLRDSLNEMKPALESASGAALVFNFAGSNDLARQIMAADKADLFLSADEGWMDKVAEAGLVDRATRRPLLSNRLVVVAPKGSAATVGSAADLRKRTFARIALADPEAVPAGKYAKGWLEKQGVWTVPFKEKIVPTPDVRAALAAVASGSVDAGVVYRTDATISPSVRVLYEIPEADVPKISYPIAVMAHSAHPKEARAAAEYLAGGEARAVFEKFGFITLK